MKKQKYFTISESDIVSIASEIFFKGAKFIQTDTSSALEYGASLKVALAEAKSSLAETVEKKQEINRILQECNL